MLIHPKSLYDMKSLSYIIDNKGLKNLEVSN